MKLDNKLLKKISDDVTETRI